MTGLLLGLRNKSERAFSQGGVSTSGGFGFGGRATTLGTGRTSIGGGSGWTCWLTTGAFAAGGLATGALAAGGFGADGRGAPAFALG